MYLYILSSSKYGSIFKTYAFPIIILPNRKNLKYTIAPLIDGTVDEIFDNKGLSLWYRMYQVYKWRWNLELNLFLVY